MRTLYRAAAVYAPSHPTATALLVDGDTITWLGRADDVGPGGADHTVELGDVLITPAFVDAHAHVTETGLVLRGVDLSGARTVTQILDAVAAAAVGSGDTAVLGHGWDETLLADRRPPTSTELDRAGGGAAVYLSRIDVHSAVISTALATACGAPALDGWDPSGRVERDAHHAARAATRDGLSPEPRRAAQVAALRAAAAAGIAAIHEMSAPHITPDDDLRDVCALGTEPDAALPDVVAYRGELVASPEEARAVVDRLGVPIAGLAGDLVVDGSVGSRTAAFRDDYADAPGHRGHLYLTAEDVRDHVAACTQAGLQAGFHVIGDAGVETALRGIRRAACQVGIAAVRAARHRLEHVEAVDAEGIANLADLAVLASVQPAFDARWGGTNGMYATRLGTERALAMNPLGALARAGLALALGSDSPVTPFDPWGAVRACVAHHVSDQRLDVATAFAAHTTGGWTAARRPGLGVLEVGAQATFAAWSLAGAPPVPGKLPHLEQGSALPRCVLTVARGRTLHDASA